MELGKTQENSMIVNNLGETVPVVDQNQIAIIVPGKTSMKFGKTW